MANEVMVRDHSIRELLPLDPMRNGEGRAEGLGEHAQAELDDDPRQQTAAALSVAVLRAPLTRAALARRRTAQTL
jgi:hypothetical protein